MSASTDDTARETAQTDIATERSGTASVPAELARLHAEIATLKDRLAAAGIA